MLLKAENVVLREIRLTKRLTTIAMKSLFVPPTCYQVYYMNLDEHPIFFKAEYPLVGFFDSFQMNWILNCCQVFFRNSLTRHPGFFKKESIIITEDIVILFPCMLSLAESHPSNWKKKWLLISWFDNLWLVFQVQLIIIDLSLIYNWGP